ncbi:MAG: hypothetical protein IH831_09225 [Planctomycetes bacterium]|nr:hypothetical protein [Planctomycetota bacterium]
MIGGKIIIGRKLGSLCKGISAGGKRAKKTPASRLQHEASHQFNHFALNDFARNDFASTEKGGGSSF